MNLKIVFLFVSIVFLMFSCSTSEIEGLNSSSSTSIAVEEGLVIDEPQLCKNHDSTFDALSVIQTAYGYLLTGNAEGFAGQFSDDTIFIHYGPVGTFPAYNTYYGKAGIAQWLQNLADSVQMNGFDVKYFVVEGNKVHTHVLEGCFSNTALNQMYIQNLHAFELDKNGKISKTIVVSESFTAVSAYQGISGLTYQTKYKNSNYMSDYIINKKDMKSIVEKVFGSLKDRNKNQFKNLISNDIEITITGDDQKVPFAGFFTGISGASDFINKFSKEVKSIHVKYYITQNNKLDVFFTEKIVSSKTGKSFTSLANFSFQLNNKGKIARIYGSNDGYSIANLY
jgi:ketosteroid isomerase-like protein